jgi:hypothetical protein
MDYELHQMRRSVDMPGFHNNHHSSMNINHMISDTNSVKSRQS